MHIGPDILCCTKICCPRSTVMSERGLFSISLLSSFHHHFHSFFEQHLDVNGFQTTHVHATVFLKMKWPLVTAV